MRLPENNEFVGVEVTRSQPQHDYRCFNSKLVQKFSDSSPLGFHFTLPLNENHYSKLV